MGNDTNVVKGLPYHGNFPYDTLEASVALPNRFTPTPNKPVDPPTALPPATPLSNNASSSRVVVPKESGVVDMLRTIDLKSALQYGTC